MGIDWRRGTRDRHTVTEKGFPMRAPLVLALVATWMAMPTAALAKAPANRVPPSTVANPRGSAYVNATLAAIIGVGEFFALTRTAPAEEV